MNKYSGSFSYNIPILAIPGKGGSYPINMGYSSGISPSSEASWVGLGWSLNVGAVNRELRGLPDDFKGDKIKTEIDQRPNWNIMWTPQKSHNEMFGIPVFDIEEGIKPKKGNPISFRYYLNSDFGLGYKAEASMAKMLYGMKSPMLDLSVSMDAQNGLNYSPTLNCFGLFQRKNNYQYNVSLSGTYSARYGWQGMNVNGGIQTKQRTSRVQAYTYGEKKIAQKYSGNKDGVKVGDKLILS